MSIARRHYERTRAQQEASSSAASGGTPAAGMPLADRMLSQLRVHKAALKGIQSRQRKAEFKRQVLPDYDAFIDGVLSADRGGQDTTVVTVMLWRIDAGMYSCAMEIAAYAMRHKLAMPEGFSRGLATTVIEELADRALAGGDESAELANALADALDLAEAVDMPDEVRGKALKALGQMVMGTDPGRAVELFDSALAIDPKCGAKTQRDRLRKSLGGVTAEPAADPTSDPASEPASEPADSTTPAGDDAGP